VQHFNAKKAPCMQDIDKFFDNPDVGEQCKTTKLTEITADNIKCRMFMNAAIDNALVEIANACGVWFKTLSGSFRPNANKKQVNQALRLLNLQDRIAFVHFVFSFVKDTLHKEVLGFTHQQACEQAFLVFFNVVYVDLPETGLTKGYKTCVSNMHNECFNRIKHHFVRGSLLSELSVSIERKSIIKPKNWKRDKHVYFVHETTNGNVQSLEVGI